MVTNVSNQENSCSYVVLKMSFKTTKSELQFPITRETIKSYRISIQEHDFWIGKSIFISSHAKAPCFGILSGIGDISNFIDRLNIAINCNSDALVPVIRKGRGPTEMSAKYEFSVYFDDYNYKQRTFTLPVSQIFEEDGKLFAPVWLMRSKLEAERNKMSRKEQYRNPPQSVFAGGKLQFQELRKLIEDEFSKLTKDYEHEKIESDRLHILVDEYLIYTQVYVHLLPEVLKSAREKFDQFFFPRGSKVDLNPDKLKSFEIIYLLPEFQEWLKDYKIRAMRVMINLELVNQFTDFILKSKSKIAIAAMSKLTTSTYSSRSQGTYGAAYEYSISRSEFIMQLPEYEAWKIKFHIIE